MFQPISDAVLWGEMKEILSSEQTMLEELTAITTDVNVRNCERHKNLS